MTYFDYDGFQRLFQLIKTAVSIFMLIVLFFILQYIFHMEFVCSCKAGSYMNGVLYMIAPPLILTFILNLIEPFHQKRTFPTYSYWRLWCKCCRSFNNCCGHVLKLFTRYIGLGAVWMSIVLLDGDWYFCLKTNLSISQAGLPCKVNLTYDETLIKAAYKTTSLDIGFGLICGFLFLWSLFEIRRAYCRMKCCTNSCTNWCTKWCTNWGINQCANWCTNWCPNCCTNQYTKCSTWCTNNCPSDCECSPYYVVVYEELLAEQVTSHLNKRLEEIATKRAESICKPYLQVIEDHEQLGNTGGGNSNVDDTVSETWKKISAFDFYLVEVSSSESNI